MNVVEAIDKRCSHRRYLGKPIKEDIVKKLTASIERYNYLGSINMQLILNNGKAFGGIRKSYGMFSGVKNYIALAGKSGGNVKEICGYYGERLVLEATQLGLGSCWVGASFDKSECACKIAAGEELYCVIAVGYTSESLSLREKLIRNVMHLKKKTLEEMYDSDSIVPGWFINGMEAVRKAPSAINLQPVTFHYKSGTVSACVKSLSAFEPIDMGIAKLHFEIGAGGGSWEFGNCGKFSRQINQAAANYNLHVSL